MSRNFSFSLFRVSLSLLCSLSLSFLLSSSHFTLYSPPVVCISVYVCVCYTLATESAVVTTSPVSFSLVPSAGISTSSPSGLGISSTGVNVLNVKIVQAPPNGIHVTWDSLDDTFTNGEKATYEIKYHKKGGDSSPSTLTTSDTEILIPNLKERAEYVVQVSNCSFPLSMCICAFIFSPCVCVLLLPASLKAT